MVLIYICFAPFVKRRGATRILETPLASHFDFLRSSDDAVDFVGHHEGGRRRGVAIQNALDARHLGAADDSAVQNDQSSRLNITDGRNGDGNRLEVPAELNRIGAIIDSLIAALGRRRGRAVNDVQFVTVRYTISIVTDLGTIAECKGLTVLLTNGHTAGKLKFAVAGLEFVGIGISLDGPLEVLGGDQVQVFDIVGVDGGRISTGGVLGNGRQTIPSNAGFVALTAANIKNALGNTGFVQMLTGFIPLKSSHEWFPP